MKNDSKGPAGSDLAHSISIAELQLYETRHGRRREKLGGFFHALGCPLGTGRMGLLRNNRPCKDYARSAKPLRQANEQLLKSR